MEDNKKRYKKWLTAVMTGIGSLMIIISGVIWYVDPFIHYHTPIGNIKFVDTRQRYSKPGIAKNFEYESVIVGSSMTENFKTTQFDGLFDTKTIKLSMAESSTRDINNILNVALNSKNKIKHVFWGLDNYIFNQESSYEIVKKPDYLYDNNLFNDVKYVLNKEVLFSDVKRTLKFTRDNQKDMSYDEMNSWYFKYNFNKSTLLEKYSRLENISKMKEKDIYYQNMNKNLNDNIIPLIEENKDIEFKFFSPPYSILYWDGLIRSGTLDATLYNLDQVYAKLLEYENVEIFYFQNRKDIICNLENYMDHIHYSNKINDYMVTAMKHGTNKLTKENYKSELKKMHDIATNYDYEAIFK